MKIVDVNILVYAASRTSEFHQPVHRWWTETLNDPSSEIGLCWTAVIGFLRIMTLPSLLPKPLLLSEAQLCVQEWLDLPNLRLVKESERHWDVLKEVLQHAGAGGNRITDSHLAAIAISYGATLASCDSGFARFPRLKWENPIAAR